MRRNPSASTAPIVSDARSASSARVRRGWIRDDDGCQCLAERSLDGSLPARVDAHEVEQRAEHPVEAGQALGACPGVHGVEGQPEGVDAGLTCRRLLGGPLAGLDGGVVISLQRLQPGFRSGDVVDERRLDELGGVAVVAEAGRPAARRRRPGGPARRRGRRPGAALPPPVPGWPGGTAARRAPRRPHWPRSHRGDAPSARWRRDARWRTPPRLSRAPSAPRRWRRCRPARSPARPGCGRRRAPSWRPHRRRAAVRDRVRGCDDARRSGLPTHEPARPAGRRAPGDRPRRRRHGP